VAEKEVRERRRRKPTKRLQRRRRKPTKRLQRRRRKPTKSAPPDQVGIIDAEIIAYLSTKRNSDLVWDLPSGIASLSLCSPSPPLDRG